MTLAFDALPHPASALSRVDARWKLVGFLPLFLACSTLQTWPSSVAALLSAGLLGWAAQLPLRWYFRRVWLTSLFLVLVCCTFPFLVRDPEPLLKLGPISVYAKGLMLALVLLLKTWAVITLMLALLVSTPLPTLLRAAHALHLPGWLVHLALLTYQHIFLLLEELHRLRIALRVRGFRNRASRLSYQILGHIAGALLVRSHERAERVAQAMRTRGFTGTFHSTTIWQTRLGDVLFCLGLCVLAAALWWWRN